MPHLKANTVGIVLAGGVGDRFGTAKQFTHLKTKPVFIHTLETVTSICEHVFLTIAPDYKSIASLILKEHDLNNVTVVSGGITRQESVKNALEVCYQKNLNDLNVLITDATRPCISKQSYIKCLEGLDEADASLAICKATNTVAYSNSNFTVMPRKDMYELLMPQCFRFKGLYLAHTTSNIKEATDDSQILLSHNTAAIIKLIEVPKWETTKLTYPEDYKILYTLLEEKC